MRSKETIQQELTETRTRLSAYLAREADIKEGERLKLYKHTNGTCNASGPAIRALRERAGISQEQLAAKLQLAGLNLNQKAVSRIETGDRVVPDFELNYFATVLGVPVCTLLEYEK